MFEKTHLIFRKKPKIWSFWEFCSNHILRQNATILWKIKPRFRREQKCQCWRERNWQSSGKKRTPSSGRFSFQKQPEKYGAKNSKNSARTKLCSGSQKKILSELSQWSDELIFENVITLKDFDKWRKNGIDEALQNRCNLTINQGTHRKKNYFNSKNSCDLRVEARKN